MLIPVITIFVSNLLIIYKTKQDELNRLRLLNSDSITYRTRRTNTLIEAANSTPKSQNDTQLKLKPYYFNINQRFKVDFNTRSSKKILKTLIRVSFSYAILDLPYLTCWLVFFYCKNFKHVDMVVDDYLFCALKIAEIFYVLNYGIKFFIYCASGSLFREHLKYSGTIDDS